MRLIRFWAVTTTSKRGLPEGIIKAREWAELRLRNDMRARGITSPKIRHLRMRKDGCDARGAVVAE